MKQNNYFQRMLSALVLLMASSLSWAHDFEAENADGVTIYYNLINNGTEAEVTYSSISAWITSYFDEVINIPETVEYDGKMLSVTSIGNDAFWGCGDLTSVTIPNSVTNIGDDAFTDCGRLTSITIPNSVTSIGNEAFSYCSSLTSVNIPESVTSIGNSAFYGCSGLTSVNIPNSVTTIGGSAFAGCSDLTSVTIGKSVVSIGERIFAGCRYLISIVVNAENPVYDSRDDSNAIIETASNTLVQGCNGTVIPESVTSIGGSAFYNCRGLTSVTIPNSVTSIGDYAFWFCSGLTSVTIPNSVTSIGDYAFWLCSGLTSVTIPEGVTSISSYAFGNCWNLTSVTIPNSVTSIGDEAFWGCDNLTSVYSLVENPFSIANSVFSGIAADATLYVPQGTKSAYESTNYWTRNFRYVVELNATGISEVNPGQSAESYAVYNLNGTKMNVKGGDLNSLPRGIYVVNGKKTIVK